MKSIIDLSGQRFGKWTVLCESERKNGRRYWKCRCDCGEERDILTSNLKRGLSQSCGCNKGTAISEKCRSHGKRNTRLYNVWTNMRRRCYDQENISYLHYGGRGITVCDEWLGDDGFQHFWDWAYENGYDENAPYGECTLDRINVNGNYEPSNCRWASLKKQMRNRTNTVLLTVNGITKPLTQWAEEYGVSDYLVSDRIKRGWNAELALSKPPKQMWDDIEYNGETHSYSEWARILGIKKDTIMWRVSRGWTLDEIMSPTGTVKHRKEKT